VTTTIKEAGRETNLSLPGSDLLFSRMKARMLSNFAVAFLDLLRRTLLRFAF